jgi:hypothetical protein
VFGIIFTRWGILRSPLRCSLKKCSTILAVCCKLHNFIIQAKGKAEATSVSQQHVDNVSPGRPWCICRTRAITTATLVAMFAAGRELGGTT